MNVKQFAGAAIGGMAGGLLGETGGDIIGALRSIDPDNNRYAGSEDPVEQRYGGAYVNYDPKRTVTTARNYGKALGGGLGALLGGIFSQYVGKPSLEGFRANAESPYL